MEVAEEAPVVIDMEVKVDTPVAASLPLSSTQDWNAVYQADQSLVFMPSELTSDTSDDPAQDWSRDATFGMSLSESISGVAVAVNTFLATPSDSPDPYLQTAIQTLQAPSTPSLAADISVSPPAEDQPSWSADSAPTNEVLPESTSNEAARAELAAMNTLDAEAALKSDNSGSGSPWYNPHPGAIKDDRRPKFCFADRSLKLALASARAQDRPIPAVTEQMITPIKALSVPVNIPSIPVEVPATPPSVSVSPPMPKSPSPLDTPAPGTISSTPPNDSAPGRAASGLRGGHALHPRGPLVSQRMAELRLESEANILLPKPSNTRRTGTVSRIPKSTTPRTTGTDSFQVAKPHGAGQSQIKASHAGGSDNRYPVLR
ncbi:hypothetical protein BC629DRAFT_756991 [Irpex lacteus]|nr:hypothetical protein BC629DRAFT_756991 [Irpex lacteus]